MDYFIYFKLLFLNNRLFFTRDNWTETVFQSKQEIIVSK